VVIITEDERVHGRETHRLKGNIDKALKESGHEVDRIFVASRTGKKVPMTPGRDVSLDKVHQPRYIQRKRKLQKPAANSWDEKLDMIQEAGAETLRRIEAKLKMPGKIAGRLKKKIASELAEFRKALEAGFTQVKAAIQGMFTSKASGNSSSSGLAAIQKHFDELWGAILNLGMLDLTTKAFSKGLITAEVKRMVFSTNGTSSEVKADALLSAIQERIKNDQSAFDVFVEILRSEPAYQHLADKLTNDVLP